MRHEPINVREFGAKGDGDGAYWDGGWGPDAPLYYASNLREYFGGGTKTFDIRVYPGVNRFYVNSLPPEGESDIDKYHIPTESEESYIVGDMVIIRLEAGEYIHLDFLRAEAE